MFVQGAVGWSQLPVQAHSLIIAKIRKYVQAHSLIIVKIRKYSQYYLVCTSKTAFYLACVPYVVAQKKKKIKKSTSKKHL